MEPVPSDAHDTSAVPGHGAAQHAVPGHVGSHAAQGASNAVAIAAEAFAAAESHVRTKGPRSARGGAKAPPRGEAAGAAAAAAAPDSMSNGVLDDEHEEGVGASGGPAVDAAGASHAPHAAATSGSHAEGPTMAQAILLQQTIKALKDTPLAQNLAALAAMDPPSLQELLITSKVDVSEVLHKLTKHMDPAKAAAVWQSYDGSAATAGQEAPPHATASAAGNGPGPSAVAPPPATSAQATAPPPGSSTPKAAASPTKAARPSAKDSKAHSSSTARSARNTEMALQSLEDTAARLQPGSVKHAIFEVLRDVAGPEGLPVTEIYACLADKGATSAWPDPRAAKSSIASTCAHDPAFVRLKQGVFALRALVPQEVLDSLQPPAPRGSGGAPVPRSTPPPAAVAPAAVAKPRKPVEASDAGGDDVSAGDIIGSARATSADVEDHAHAAMDVDDAHADEDENGMMMQQHSGPPPSSGNNYATLRRECFARNSTKCANCHKVCQIYTLISVMRINFMHHNRFAVTIVEIYV